MADTLNKPKLQLRTSFGVTIGEKTPSPATKLLISHGKPNFTIQKSAKENGSTNGSASPTETNNNTNNINNNYYPYKTASTVSPVSPVIHNNNPVVATKAKLVEPTPQDNEAIKVVLRKTAPKVPEPPVQVDEDENVPEFIKRQRQIQERLAKENILDFENRRSGYFTTVMISPTSPNRTSFGETMASPAIVPSLEIPPPAMKEIHEELGSGQQEHKILSEDMNGHSDAFTEHSEKLNGHSEEMNGQDELDQKAMQERHIEEAIEEEVAKAIEEVNKAVAGEDDEKLVEEEDEAHDLIITAVPIPAAREEALKEEETKVEHQEETVEAKVLIATLDNESLQEPASEKEADIMGGQVTEEKLHEHHETNGHSEENGHNEETVEADEGITISHTNALQDGPRIPSPDPSGALGVNFEPKTVVSFSKELGSEPNKYPDTVVVVKEGEPSSPINPEVQEMAKLKFDIKGDENEIEVTPVLKTE